MEMRKKGWSEGEAWDRMAVSCNVTSEIQPHKCNNKVDVRCLG